MPGLSEAKEVQREKRTARLMANEARVKTASCNLPAFGPACSRLCRGIGGTCPSTGGIDKCVSPNKPQ